MPQQLILSDKNRHKLGDISCQFLSPAGSMGLKYILQLLFIEILQNANNSATTEARE
jgi:hypothetical protein